MEPLKSCTETQCHETVKPMAAWVSENSSHPSVDVPRRQGQVREILRSLVMAMRPSVVLHHKTKTLISCSCTHVYECCLVILSYKKKSPALLEYWPLNINSCLHSWFNHISSVWMRENFFFCGWKKDTKYLRRSKWDTVSQWERPQNSLCFMIDKKFTLKKFKSLPLTMIGKQISF